MKKHRLLTLICILVFFVVLSGCSDRLKENKRVSVKAKRYAKKLAVEYIADKYGIKAEPLGYDIQGNDVFMAYESTTGVAVPMQFENEQFCVYLDLDREDIRFDNRQGLEVAQVLESYFLEQSGLPPPAYSNLEFWLWMRGYRSMTSVWIGDTAYSMDRMLNFYYDGQSAEEILEQIEMLDYTASFVQPDLALENVGFDPADWPNQDNFSFSANLFLLSADKPSAKGLSADIRYDEKLDWEGLKEYIGYDFSYQDNRPVVERKYHSYLTETFFDIDFTSMLPFAPGACLKVSEEKPVWIEEKRIYGGFGDNKISEKNTYEQISPLFYFEYLDDGSLEGILPPNEEPGVLCSIPQSYFDQYGDELYIGVYWSDKQKISLLEDTAFGDSINIINPSLPNDSSYGKCTILKKISTETISKPNKKKRSAVLLRD